MRSLSRLLVVSGLLGCAALVVYFSGPFLLFPFPSADASSAQIQASATTYSAYYALAAWLQVSGTFLIVAFLLGLVYLSGAWTRFAGWLVFLTSAAILVLSLNEATYFLGAAEAVANGHPDAAVTSFDLTYVFLHTFFLVPSPLLALAFVLRDSRLLPRFVWVSALAIGVAFVILGLVGLLLPVSTVVIGLLVVMLIWIVAAAICLARARIGISGAVEAARATEPTA